MRQPRRTAARPALRRGLLGRGTAADVPENLRDHLKAFLDFLAFNRNVSPHTVRAYESDVTQYLAWVASDRDRRISQLSLTDLDSASVREWVASLNRAGQARSTVARKLSGARAFVDYLQHEGVIATDPTAAAVAPKLDKTIPVHLSEQEMTALLTIEGVWVATKGYTDGLQADGFSPLSDVVRQFVNNGGKLWVCGACAKPRGIAPEHLIEGAQIVGAATAVEAMVNGAQTLSF